MMTFSPLNRSLFGAAIALVALLVAFVAVRADEQKTELPVASSDTVIPANAYRVLFIGNSITRHGTNPEILARLKWDHTSGMAASSESKDYVHLLTAKLAIALPTRTVVIRMTSLVPGGLGTPDERLAPVLKVAPEFAPDLVILQHGEHERSDLGETAVADTYNRVLDYIQSLPSHPTIVCVGPWSTGFAPGATVYGGWPATVEHVMSDICAKRGIPFVSVDGIAADPKCHGDGDHPGVKWHPNDAGHAGYAGKIFEVLKAGVLPGK